jgi:orotate phosphoribosyltransferase
MNWLEYHEEPVTLHSGGRSHWLVRGDQIFYDEKLREAVLDCWSHYIRQYRPPYFFWAIPTGGSFWAEAIAERFGCSWANRPGPSQIPNNATTFTVDDVLTTGSSLSDHGSTAALVVVDRDQREMYVPHVVSWAKIHLPILVEDRYQTSSRHL